MDNKNLFTKTNGEYTYIMTKSTADIEDIGIISVYGITILSDSEYISADDISCEYSKVKELFDLIVPEKLFPEHLYDVVEDFLC